MSGILTFPTLEAAVRAGFEVFDRLSDGGYLVRKRFDTGWQMAFVRPDKEMRENQDSAYFHFDRGGAPEC